MDTTNRTWTVARQIAFFSPQSGHGKYHAVFLDNRLVCGAALNLSADAVIRTAQGQWSSAVHKIICRKCLALTTQSGRTAEGVRQ